eukprot:scaffold1275_cov401-Prasinococcus_capsulatus_cf.AAC.2
MTTCGGAVLARVNPRPRTRPGIAGFTMAGPVGRGMKGYAERPQPPRVLEAALAKSHCRPVMRFHFA